MHPSDVFQLQRLATQAKESLSNNPHFGDTLLSDAFGIVLLDLSRDELEALILNHKTDGRNMIERSLDCVLSTYRAAEVFDLRRKGRLIDPKDVYSIRLEDMARDIDRVILVGGVTRMPLVRERLTQLFDQKLLAELDVVDPINAVAVGAAYPVEAEHFNLLYPPYSIELALSEQEGVVDRVLVLHRAFDKLDYFSRWLSDSRCTYEGTKFVVDRDYQSARLRFSGNGIEDDGVPLGCRDGDCFQVIVDLAGRVRLHCNGRPRASERRVPISHPVQEEIIEADENRRSVNLTVDPDEEPWRRIQRNSVMHEN